MNFANPGLLAGKVDQNSLSTSALQHENQRIGSEERLSKKLNASSAANVGEGYGSELAMRVVSRDGDRQVSSTHGDEVKDQVRALDGGEEMNEPSRPITDASNAVQTDGNQQLPQMSPNSNDRDEEPQPAQPFLPDVQVPNNLAVQ